MKSSRFFIPIQNPSQLLHFCHWVHQAISSVIRKSQLQLAQITILTRNLRQNCSHTWTHVLISSNLKVGAPVYHSESNINIQVQKLHRPQPKYHQFSVN